MIRGEGFRLGSVVATALAVCVCACSSVESRRDEALASLVGAERAFAATSASQGARAAFAANFAPDGIAFEPAPVDAAHAFFSRPAPPDAKAVALDWTPIAAGVSLSNDLGFTTGPFSLTDRESGRSLRNGVYFSVWKRYDDGRWLVALDAGIATPSPVPASALAPSPTLAGARGDADAARQGIAAFESRAVDATEYARWFAADGRLHRDGYAPFVGDAAVREHLATLAGNDVSFEADGGAVASSGDLAYTYGAYRVTPHGGAAQLASGYFAHLWSRDARGDWRIVVAVLIDAQ